MLDSLRFLGTGSAGSGLGSSAAVLEQAGEPRLLIDCGPDVLARYRDRYQRLPEHLYITHCHMDHIGGLERLFFQRRFGDEEGNTHLYIASHLVPLLCQRVADYPGLLAEGGANFFDTIKLVPVVSGFWLHGMYLSIYPVRHHAPLSAFSLHLPGVLFYSGDTRPIPEILHHRLSGNEVIAHDCGMHANPSHTAVDDLRREYDACLWPQLWLYHYADAAAARRLAAEGFHVAMAGEAIPLPGLASASKPALHLSRTA